MKKLKHLLGTLFICLAAFTALPTLAYGATSVKSADGNWGLLADYNKDTCTVYQWYGASDKLAIPSYIDGLKVTKIDFGYQVGRYDWNRIANRKMITSISIPSTVTALGDGCFDNLPNVKAASIPPTVKEIGTDLFGDCTSLTSFVIPKVLDVVPKGMFESCSSLSEVTLHSGIKEIHSGAFAECTSLKSIKLPSKLTYIGGSAFSQSGLKSISIPNSVKTIKYYAFYGCKNLTSVKLPTGITEIAMKTFMNCEALKFISIPANVKNVSHEAFSGCQNLTTVLFKGDSDIAGYYTAIQPTAILTIYAPSTAAKVQKYCSDKGIRFRPLTPPTFSSKKRTASTVTLTWKKVKDATGYRVYKKTGSGSYKQMKTTSSTSFKDTGLKKGVTYSYYVTTLRKDALGNTLESKSSSVYKTNVKK